MFSKGIEKNINISLGLIYSFINSASLKDDSSDLKKAIKIVDIKLLSLNIIIPIIIVNNKMMAKTCLKLILITSKKEKYRIMIIEERICIFTNKKINTDAISSSERIGERYKFEFCRNRNWKRFTLNKNNTKNTDKIKTIVLCGHPRTPKIGASEPSIKKLISDETRLNLSFFSDANLNHGKICCFPNIFKILSIHVVNTRIKKLIFKNLYNFIELSS